MPDSTKVYAPFRCVASYADGSRLTFDGMTREQAHAAMVSATDEHGDFSVWDWVTDESYIDGEYHALHAPPPLLPFSLIDVTDAENPQKALQDPFDPHGEP